MAIYGTPNNNTGSVFGFGNVTNTKFNQVLGGNQSETDLVAIESNINRAYAAGSLDVYGDYVIFAGRQTDINGIANAEAGTIGTVVQNQKGGLQKGRKVEIFSINNLTNEIVYTAGSWEQFDFVGSDGVTASADSVALSIESPYSVPSTFSYLYEVTPETVSYSLADGSDA